MPKKETFTSRFEETRGGRVPQKSKIWGDVVYGWSPSEIVIEYVMSNFSSLYLTLNYTTHLAHQTVTMLLPDIL